ncbi:helix-turn-helix domain-containing protein [Photobacterium damselae]|uniref:helix-turn-helix domain-containing protein n=1 Tax=Photobacterium damselae TaxID=38293 RepID=UPI0040679B62|nr:hypothetical protein [Photobacterium damselae]
MDTTTKFSSIITEYRMKHGLTQREFLDLLHSRTNSLDKIDLVTLSRWENSHTNPSFKRKVIILYLLDELKNYLFISNKIDIEKNELNEYYNLRFNSRTNLAISLFYDLNNIDDFANLNLSYENELAIEKIKTFYSSLFQNEKKEITQLIENMNSISIYSHNKFTGISIYKEVNSTNLTNHLSTHSKINALIENTDYLNSDSILIIDSLSLTKSSLKILNLETFIRLSSYKIKNLYILTSDYNHYKFCIKNGFSSISNIYTDSTKMFLISIDSISYITNKSLLNHALFIIRQLKYQNSILLDKIMKI